MALRANILGMVYTYPEVFVVGREQVKQFALAVKSPDPASLHEEAAAELGHDTLVAGPTFVSILALLVQQDFFRSEEHTSELQSLMRISYAVFCLKKKIHS